jgi:hypothetical protein
MCESDVIWKKKCEEYGYNQDLQKIPSITKEHYGIINYKQMFRYLNSAFWDSNFKHANITLSNNNKTVSHTGDSWYVALSKSGNKDGFGNSLSSKTWHVRYQCFSVIELNFL